MIEAALPANAHCEDRTLADIAAAAGTDPLDAMLDLALAEDLQTVFAALTLNSDEVAVGRMLTHPHSMVSLSDAGAHLSFFCDAGYGLHLLGHWVRALGVHGVWVNGSRIADARGMCADAGTPGKVLREFHA